MLTINPSELIWTLLGFLALYFLLKHFLYTPLIRTMDQRNAKIREGLEDEQEALDALRAQEECLEQGREKSRDAARTLLDGARRQDEQLHDERIGAARIAAQQAEDTAQERADRLCQQASDRLREHSEELAGALAEHLFNEGNQA